MGKKSSSLLGAFLPIVLFALVYFFAGFQYHSDVEIVTFEVSSKERVNSGQSGDYLIFTDGEVFTVSDSVWLWRFDSSDIYGRLEEGNTYKASAYGWRVPFLSWYRNIDNVQPINN